MILRTEYALAFLMMAGSLGICAWAARRSVKAISKSVEKLLTTMILTGLAAITISAGAAPGAGVSTPADWFDRADKALYKTKRSGRKGVTLFEDEAAARR